MFSRWRCYRMYHATQQKSESGFLAFQAGTILQVASRVLAHEFSAEVVRSGPLWALCREHPWRRLWSMMIPTSTRELAVAGNLALRMAPWDHPRSLFTSTAWNLDCGSGVKSLHSYHMLQLIPHKKSFLGVQALIIWSHLWYETCYGFVLFCTVFLRAFFWKMRLALIWQFVSFV